MLQVSVHCRQFRHFESNCSCIWNRSLSLALWATRLVHWLARPTGMSFAIVRKLGESGTLVVLSRSKVYTKQNENWSKKLGKNKKIKEVGPKNKTLEEIYFPSQNVLLPSAAMVLQLAMLILYRSEVRGVAHQRPFTNINRRIVSDVTIATVCKYAATGDVTHPCELCSVPVDYPHDLLAETHGVAKNTRGGVRVRTVECTGCLDFECIDAVARQCHSWLHGQVACATECGSCCRGVVTEFLLCGAKGCVAGQVQRSFCPCSVAVHIFLKVWPWRPLRLRLFHLSTESGLSKRFKNHWCGAACILSRCWSFFRGNQSL